MMLLHGLLILRRERSPGSSYGNVVGENLFYSILANLV